MPTITGARNSWAAMIRRCTNPKDHGFKHYGGRGITVCKRWMVWKNFLLDMGQRPSGLSLGRINNEKGYSKKNCQWETHSQQARNKRDTRRIAFRGEVACIADLCDRLKSKVPPSAVYGRIKQGWTLDDAFSVPLYSKNPKASPHYYGPCNRLSDIVDIIESVESRCMACDGPVGKTSAEITEKELRQIYLLAKLEKKPITWPK